MALEPLIIFLVIGAIAGWLAGVIVRGYGFGVAGNVVVGVIGSFVGGWLFTHFHLIHGRGWLGGAIGATVGAVVLLLLIRLFRRRPFLQRMFRVRWGVRRRRAGPLPGPSTKFWEPDYPDCPAAASRSR